MITFNRVKWRNFLSTGNSFTEIQLDAHLTTLILGDNGSGKSTILDAVCYALFNRPYRDINKPQLINSVNLKNCVVELDFIIGTKQYKVVRGLKPSTFEIWVNGLLLNQDAATKDYQIYLEESILKLNFKSFTQIVILGAASFTPFMQLPAASRREVIEDILDIKIFTSMNFVLKQKQIEVKEQLKEIEGQLKIARQRAEVQQQYIATLQEDRQQRLADIQQKVDQALQENDVLDEQIRGWEIERDQLLETIKGREDLERQLTEISQHLHHLTTMSASLEDEAQFFHNNDTCTKCKQLITEEFKEQISTDLLREANRLAAEQEQYTAQLLRVDTQLSEIREVQTLASARQDLIASSQIELQTNHRFVQRLELERADLMQKTDNIHDEKQKLKDLAKDALAVAKQRTEHHETQHYYEIASLLLKDTGIKTRIIKQYLPVINKLVNKHLAAMDFFVKFTLDEKFDEKIKSRHRDEFSYASFSQGEKQRIDLALLFTWRTVAKLKNSASTNLLILDEVFDSSLDSDATEQVMALLNTLGAATNVWVISHRGDVFGDKFQNTIKFEKRGNFSIVV